MLKKYIAKFTIDVLPSLVATILGAYIVQHYIVAKPGADTPPAATASTEKPAAVPPPALRTETVKFDAGVTPEAAKDGAKDGVAGDIAVGDRPAADKTASDKTASSPAPAEPKRNRFFSRDKSEKTAKAAPATNTSTPPATTSTPAATDPAATADERRDANDMARAAIERLRRSPPTDAAAARGPESPGLAAHQDASRSQEAARTPSAPVVATTTAMQPLPPAISIATARPDFASRDGVTGAIGTSPAMSASQGDDAHRPTPPADIPTSRPLDLRADISQRNPADHTSVADDMLSAAKSVFHAVLPK